MVLPIIAAAGARAAGTAAARSAATATVRTGASTAGRAASTGVRKGTSQGVKVVRTQAGSSGAPATGARQASSSRQFADKMKGRARDYVRDRAEEFGDDRYEEEQVKQEIRQAEDASGKTEYRIGWFVGLLLVLLALVLDVAEIILFFTTGIGGFVKDAASYVFILIFWMLGAPFWKGNKWVAKMNTMAATYIVGLIPGISDFVPELTIGVLTVFLYTRVEDKLQSKLELVKKVNDKITRFKRSREKVRPDKAA